MGALPVRAVLLAAFTLTVCLGLPGCGQAVFSRISSSAGQPDVRSAPTPTNGGWDKTRVLDELGPPVEVLPLLNGDVFVYRVQTVDQRILQFETGSFAAANMVVYSEFNGWRSDYTLMCLFDEAGQLSQVTSSHGRDR